MSATPPTAIADVDLSPKPGKTYFNCEREWREELIYFLMVDRFHDSTPRKPALKPGRTPGVNTPNDFYGGTIKGITGHLDYIAGLGCTVSGFPRSSRTTREPITGIISTTI